MRVPPCYEIVSGIREGKTSEENLKRAIDVSERQSPPPPSARARALEERSVFPIYTLKARRPPSARARALEERSAFPIYTPAN